MAGTPRLGNVLAGVTPDVWQSSVVSNLTQADGTHKQALEKKAEGISSIRSTNAEWGRQRDQVSDQFSQKLRNTQELSKQLSSRINANRKNLQQTEWSQKRLTKALQDIAAPMDLCRQRLGMRQKRPKREAVFDPFQEALLREEEELHKSKQKLSDAIADTHGLLRDLRQSTAELEGDLQDKQHSYTLDSICVDKKAIENTVSKLDRSYNRAPVEPKVALPELFGTPRRGNDFNSTAESEGRAQERERQKATLQSIEVAISLENTARERWKTNGDVLERCSRAAQAAAKTTQAEMGAKIEHTELLRHELVRQKRATEQKIAQTQKCLSMTSDKMAFLEKPMSAGTRRAQVRGMRTPREATTDEVSEALQDQQYALQGKQMHLQGQIASMRATLNDLESTHATLSDDVAYKERALSIDRGCAATKKTAHGYYSYGFAKVGQGQKHFSDTASSRMRQAREV